MCGGVETSLVRLTEEQPCEKCDVSGELTYHDDDADRAVDELIEGEEVPL